MHYGQGTFSLESLLQFNLAAIDFALRPLVAQAFPALAIMMEKIDFPDEDLTEAGSFDFPKEDLTEAGSFDNFSMLVTVTSLLSMSFAAEGVVAKVE